MIISCGHQAQLEVLFAVTELQPDQSSQTPSGKRCLLTASAWPAARSTRSLAVRAIRSSVVLEQQPSVTRTVALPCYQELIRQNLQTQKGQGL